MTHRCYSAVKCQQLGLLDSYMLCTLPAGVPSPQLVPVLLEKLKHASGTRKASSLTPSLEICGAVVYQELPVCAHTQPFQLLLIVCLQRNIAWVPQLRRLES